MKDTERPAHYKLDGHTPVPCTLEEWAGSMEDRDARRVNMTLLGPYRISTVFLGLDHQFYDGPPLLFETMIFGGKFDNNEYQTRCSTWAQAEVMHQIAVSVAGNTHGDTE